MFDFLITFYFVGSVLAVAGYIYMLMVMNENSGETPWYSLWKMVADFIGVFVTSWLAIPFLIMTISSLKGINPPHWASRFVFYFVYVVKALIRGKEYK